MLIANSHLTEIPQAIDSANEAYQATRGYYEMRGLSASVGWRTMVTMTRGTVKVQKEWLEGPGLEMYQGHIGPRRDLMRQELVEKLKEQFQTAGNWKLYTTMDIWFMRKEMLKYTTAKKIDV